VALGADGPGLAAIALAAVAALAAIVAVSPIAVLAVTAAMAAAKVRFNFPPADQCPIQGWHNDRPKSGKRHPLRRVAQFRR
jgi:hypothetical protein